MTGFPCIRMMGLDGVLVSFSDQLDPAANRAALAFATALREAALPGVREVAPTLASTFVGYDPVATDPDALIDGLQRLVQTRDWTTAPPPTGRKLWTIPACFDGDAAPDLAEAAKIAGMSPEAAVHSICGAALDVLTLGFMPGQPYLGFLDPVWDLPRRSSVTPQVPAGAVLLAVRQLVLFARPMPTGWGWVGQMAFRPFDWDSDPPIPLTPGDRLQLTPVSQDRLDQLRDDPLGGATVEALP